MGFKYSIRPAGSGDWGTVLKMIGDLVESTGMGPADKLVTCTVQDLEASSSGEHPLVHGIVVEAVDDEETHTSQQPFIVGFALYYYAFCCMTGKMVYLEDLYLEEGHKGKGLGKKLMSKVAKIGADNGCKNMQWMVLTSNEAARGFYDHIKASDKTGLGGWRFNRLEGENFVKLANTE